MPGTGRPRRVDEGVVKELLHVFDDLVPVVRGVERSHVRRSIMNEAPIGLSNGRDDVTLQERKDLLGFT